MQQIRGRSNADLVTRLFLDCNRGGYNQIQVYRFLCCSCFLMAFAPAKPQQKAAEPQAKAAAPQTKLSVVKAMLHDSEDGPPVPADYLYHPGDVVFFSFQVAGYTKVGEDPIWKIDVAYEMDVRDSEGVLIAPPDVASVGTSVSPQDKDWLPKIRYQFAIPPLAESGQYRILIKVWDRLGKTETNAEQTFRVEGHEVAPSDTLVIRNLRFLRTEEDKEPLAIAAYRPGDTLFARFDITGYKFGDGNAFDVEYGIAVADSTGKVMYAQPVAAEEKTKSFYPQRYTPGEASLKVPPNMTKAAYTLIVTAKDKLGGQTAEARHAFTIE